MADIGKELHKIGRRKLLGQLNTTDRLIKQVYRRAAEQLGERAARTKQGSLTERWVNDYRRSIDEQIQDMDRRIYGIIKDGARNAAQTQADVTGDYMRAIYEKSGVSDTFSNTLSRIPDEALNALIGGGMYKNGRGLSDMVWSATGRLQGGIEEVLAQGIAQQQSAYQIAKALEAYVNPDAATPYDWRNVYPDIPFPLNVDYNCQRLARTATNHVGWTTRKGAARENVFCTGLQWVLSNAHYVRQIRPYGPDVCDDYAQHDEGLGKGVYPIDDIPFPHPLCLCDQIEVLPSLDDAADRLARWADGGSDTGLDKAFARAQGASLSVRSNYGGAIKKYAPTIHASDDEMEPGLKRRIEQVVARISADFPTVSDLVKNIRLTDDPGIASFRGWVDPADIYQSEILLDKAIWKNSETLRRAFEDALASGHTRNANDPMFIVSHEIGHAIHMNLALRQIGYEYGKPMSIAQKKAFRAAYDSIAVDVFEKNAVFAHESYNTAEKIFQAIEDEMGYRGTQGGNEFIAQSVAMVYNGYGKRAISKAVYRYLKIGLR